MITKISVKDQILIIFKESLNPLAIHELGKYFNTVSQNNLATRCNELEREHYLSSQYRVKDSKRLAYKEWEYTNINAQ